jgi:hypothetical protein
MDALAALVAKKQRVLAAAEELAALVADDMALFASAEVASDRLMAAVRSDEELPSDDDQARIDDLWTRCHDLTRRTLAQHSRIARSLKQPFLLDSGAEHE